MARSWLKRRRSRGATETRALTTFDSCTMSPSGAAHEDAREGFRRCPLVRRQRHRDVILFRTDLEGRDIAAAKQGFEGAPDHRDVETEIRHAVAIDRDLDLRLVETHVGIEIGQAWIVPQPLDQLVRKRVDLLIGCGRLDDELQRLAEAADAQRCGVRGRRLNARNLAQLWQERLRDLLLLDLTFVPVLETREGQEARDLACPDDHQVGTEFGHPGQNLLDLSGIALGVGEAGPLRRISGDR